MYMNPLPLGPGINPRMPHPGLPVGQYGPSGPPMHPMPPHGGYFGPPGHPSAPQGHPFMGVTSYAPPSRYMIE